MYDDWHSRACRLCLAMTSYIVKGGPVPSPRERMIQSAAQLFRERGIAATSFADVIEHSGAPRGSIYHHFPGGKAQLAQETTRYAGQFLATVLAARLETGNPITAIRAFIAYWSNVLRDSDYAAGCPVLAAALGADQAPEAQRAAGAAFATWQQLLTEGLQRADVPEDRARSLAALTVAAIEGAIVLARAQRSLAPLDQVGRELEVLASHVLPDTRDA